MSLHIRILWGLLDAKAVPQDPPSELLRLFSARFSTEAELFVSRDTGPELISRHLILVGTTMSAAKGRIAAQACLVEEHMLGYIQACLSRFGLQRWCPDLRQSAYSLYNSACRIIAIDTFKQALISHAYIHLSPNALYTSNMDILIKLYDHFVFHYLLLRYRREGRQPGSVQKALQSNPQYRGRIRVRFLICVSEQSFDFGLRPPQLAAARLKFLVENGYPQRYRDLIDPKATSDDEYDANRKVYLIKRRTERSSEVEKFYWILDRKREEAVRQDKSRRWCERVRKVPVDQQDSVFSALPEGMPIDYYDPEFFNQLQPRTRNRIAIRKISLLPLVTESLTWNSEERLSDRAFTKKYGAPVLSQYEMVDDADVEDDVDDEWAAEDIDEDMPVDDDDRVNVDDMNASRSTISTHLSTG